MSVEKYCPGCGFTKPTEDFYKSRSIGTGLQPKCKDCQKSRYQTYEYKSQYRKSWLKYAFNITPEQYEEMLSRGCQSCGSMEDLCIDHDHGCCLTSAKTCGNCIRGVLCAGCNKAEGLLKSDPDRARGLYEYLLRVTNKEAMTYL